MLSVLAQPRVMIGQFTLQDSHLYATA